MALTKITTDMNIVAALDDEPNDVGGLTAAQLKAKFDEGGAALKTYINDTLTEEIDTDIATKAEVQAVVLGQIPDGTITEAKLASTFALGNVDANGAIGSTEDLPVFTGTSGVVETKTAANAMLTLINGLSSVTPTTSDLIPLKDASETASGYSTIEDIIGLAMQIETGSYTGTGTYGSSNPTVLTVSDNAKILCLLERVYTSGGDVYNLPYNSSSFMSFVINVGSLTSSYTSYHPNSSFTLQIKKSDNNIYWYSANSADHQNNTASYIYRYFTIG